MALIGSVSLILISIKCDRLSTPICSQTKGHRNNRSLKKENRREKETRQCARSCKRATIRCLGVPGRQRAEWIEELKNERRKAKHQLQGSSQASSRKAKQLEHHHVVHSVFSQVSDGSNIAQIICIQMKISYRELKQNVLNFIPWKFFFRRSGVDSSYLCVFKFLRRFWTIFFSMSCCFKSGCGCLPPGSSSWRC